MLIQIQLAQIPFEDGATSQNLEKVLQVIEGADPTTDLIVFPETCLMGFPNKDNVASLSEPEDGPTLSAVRKAINKTGVSAAIGFAEADEGKFYNTTVLISPQGTALKYRKSHLWSSDVGIFDSGDHLVTAIWKGIRVGILICFDIEFPENARALAAQGAELLIVTDANMDPYGPVHRTLIVARAIENQIFAALANRCGSDGDLTFAGESVVVSPAGQILAAMGRAEGSVVVKIDTSEIEKSRKDYNYLDLRRIHLRLDQPQENKGILSQKIVPISPQ